MDNEQKLKMARRAHDAGTRFTRAVSLLVHWGANATREEERWLVGYEAGELLRKVLYDIDALVELLNEDADEDLERHAKNAYAALKARRLIVQLRETSGRTPEEIEAFEAKAQQLEQPSGTLRLASERRRMRKHSHRTSRMCQ